MPDKCEYCGRPLDSSKQFCESCNAPNPSYKPESTNTAQGGAPATIEELKLYCSMKNLPLEKMRFFIGEDYRGAKAFGIFKGADGEFVVYKNKADGTRAVRYKGPDEYKAVSEIYNKLNSEMELRRGSGVSSGLTPVAKSTGGFVQNKKSLYNQKTNAQKLSGAFWTLITIGVIGGGIISSMLVPNRGYYDYNGRDYYYQNSTWYVYDTAYSIWEEIPYIDAELESNYGSYYISEDYESGSDYSDFANSGFYDDYDYDDNSDWDDDWDDWSDWDSDMTDWDSDW